METLLYIVIGLLVLAIILLAVVLLRKNTDEEMSRQLLAYRQETEANQRQLKEMVQEDQRRLLELVQGEQQRLKQDVLQQLQVMNSGNSEAAERLGKNSIDTMSALGEQLKSSLNNQLGQLQNSQNGQNAQLNQALGDRLAEIRTSVDDKLKSMNSNLGESIFNLKETQAHEMQVFNDAVKEKMQVMNQSVDKLQADLTQRMESLQKNNEEKLERLREANESKLEHMRNVLERGMTKMQADNDKKLEDIRITVGEKLQSTLEERLALSFKSVNDNLRHVFESVGEMKELANEVGSLKNVLGNVKLRGNFGETQLAAILEEILAPDQYATNVATIPGSKDRVEFAVKMPGGENGFVYLPIDAKFPADLYNHLQEAKQQGDKNGIQEAYKALHTKVLFDAKDISSKYIKSPHTTDFAIMFLPFEGLYSEVLTLPGIIEELQKKHHIIIAGPSNMVAMLNSLRLGFRTLALQKRTAEVWSTLEAVKSEFAKFGECMEKMRNHLDLTSKDLDNLMGTRSRAINKSLNKMESMEIEKAEELLELDSFKEE